MSSLHTIQIGDRVVGSGAPCWVVAEVAQAHDGDVDRAHLYIDAAAKAGADAVKFQTHIAAAESTIHEPWRVQFGAKDKSRYDYWKRMEFSQATWKALSDHAREAGLVFLSSPFSFEAIDLLQDLDVPAWKLGAGEITNTPMIRYAAQTGKPVLLSSGLASWATMDAAVECVRDAGAPLALYQCTTAYPCPPEKIGLNVMHELRERYGCPVGLSDHSGTIFAGLAAAALGANMIEVHIKLSEKDEGPDAPASLIGEGLAQLIAGVRYTETMLAHPVDKESMAHELDELSKTFGKSVVAASDLKAGHKLTIGDLSLKKPGTGIPASQRDDLVNRTLKRDVSADTLLSDEDIE